MTLFGRVAWLRHAELFEVLLGWFGRIGPIGRRVVVESTCEDCGEDCDPQRCVDCPECSAAAEPGERAAELRPWFVGLTEVQHAQWSDAGFIILALAGVTYDGLQETAFWGALMQPLFVAVWEAFGALNTVLIIQTLGLAAVWVVFLIAFSVATALTRRLHDPLRTPPPMGRMIGVYAATLLPIAAGYLIAHYLTLLIQGIVWLPQLLADPLLTVAPPLDWIPVSVVWYLSVGAIVIGHIVAVVLAHRIALRDSPSRPAAGGAAAGPADDRVHGDVALDHRGAHHHRAGRRPVRRRCRGSARMSDISLALAFVAGVLSFISPCVLALVPVYLAFLGETAAVASTAGASAAPWRGPVFAQALLFVAGFSILFILLGISVGLLGHQLFGADRPLVRQVAGLLVIALGLVTTGLFGPILDRLSVRAPLEVLPAARSARAVGLGMLVGIGWTPCIGAVLGAILTMGASSADVGAAALLLTAYSAGLAVPFLAAALALPSMKPVLDWLRRHHRAVQVVSGLFIMAIGVLIFTDAFTRIASLFTFFI